MFHADKVFLNGNIITMNLAQPKAEAVAVYQDKIIAVGSRTDLDALIGPGTKKIDLHGSTMIPGINEAHAHLLQYGLDCLNAEVTPEICPNIPALLKLVAARAAEAKPGEWIQGWGWDEVRMEEGRAPTVQELSAAAPNNPVYLMRTCFHVAVVNQMALEKSGITDTTADPEGGKIFRDESGHATGLLHDNAKDFIRDAMTNPDKAILKKAIAAASKIYNSKGITSTTDASLLAAVDEPLPAWCEAELEGLLTVRTSALMLPEVAKGYRTLGLPSNFGNDMFKFGCIKFIMDGSVGGGGAGMTKPYLKKEYGTGLMYMEQDELTAKVKSAHDAGYQISIHGIGDATLDRVLTALESALRDNPRADHRHRIEHFSMSYPHLLDRAKAIGVTINMNPAFLYFLGDSHLLNIGQEVYHEFAMKSALDRGIVVSAGSDCPVTNIDPRYSLFAMTNRETINGRDCGKAERLSMEQALYAFTMAGAYQNFDEKKKGSIEVGKYADFAVLSMDPLAGDTREILNLKTLMTVLGGEIVYTA